MEVTIDMNSTLLDFHPMNIPTMCVHSTQWFQRRLKNYRTTDDDGR